MTECPPCRHIKEDGTYCGSPALQNRQYCYYHLTHRGRRLRRARALRDQVHYRLEIPPLEDLASAQVALSEVVQAMGTGQLDYRTGGKMLYGIQQAASLMKYRAKLEAAQPEQSVPQVRAPQLGDNLGSPHDDDSRVHDYPAFEREFDIAPGADLDSETEWTLRKADEAAELRHANDLPAPPPDLRPGSPQYKVYREEAYQSLNTQINYMRRELREYHEMKRQEIEKMKKEALSAKPSPQPLATSA